MDHSSFWIAGTLLVVGLSACAGPSQVSFAANERPSAYGTPQGVPPPAAAHRESTDPRQPEAKEEQSEPDRPAVETRAQRALVHIHGPDNNVCSGVVLGPRIVATVRRCLSGIPEGVTTLGSKEKEFQIEIASSALTWTMRRAAFAVVPTCDLDELDVGILVLKEPIEWVEPLHVVSAPNTGARVQALGLGRCKGARMTMSERIGAVRSRSRGSMVIDVPLCRGDAGGPVIEGRNDEIVGLISQRDDPEESPLSTTRVSRLDTVHARELLQQAKLLTEGLEMGRVHSIACVP